MSDNKDNPPNETERIPGDGAVTLPRVMLPSRGPVAMVLKPHFERGMTGHLRDMTNRRQNMRGYHHKDSGLPPPHQQQQSCQEKTKPKRGRHKNEHRVVTILQMNPLPHTRHKIIAHTDRELELMKSLSRRRRDPIPDSHRVAIQQDPPANILSRWYEPGVRTRILKSRGLVLLPPPSLMGRGKMNGAEDHGHESHDPDEHDSDVYEQKTESNSIADHNHEHGATNIKSYMLQRDDDEYSLAPTKSIRSAFNHMHITPVPSHYHNYNTNNATTILPRIIHREQLGSKSSTDLSWQKNVPGYRDTIDEIDFYLMQKPVVIYMKKQNGQSVPKPRSPPDNITLASLSRQTERMYP